VKIDTSLARQLIASQFPEWANLPIAPVEMDGWDNRTFRLGTHMSVRLPSAEPYALQVDKEHRWLRVLAPELPLPIPTPLARGKPTDDYPFEWSVYRWIEGELATVERIDDLNEFARTLAGFLGALQQVDPTDGPAPGLHCFYRGGPVETYDAETRAAITALGDRIDAGKATAAWEAALAATWPGPPVWFHGDVAATNLLVNDGRLSAVIDFGCSGIGDPACDVTIAWTLLSGESRNAFRGALPVDDATWVRGSGWALWKGLITLAQNIDSNPSEAAIRHVVEEVLAEC
jgi:aminoglycoside phosphotransferase (APT) family kinase protein